MGGRRASKSTFARRRVRLLAVAVAALIGATTASARADSPPNETRTVEIVLAGSDPNVAAMHTLIRELLVRDGIGVIVSRTERIEPQTILSNHGGAASAYIWIDLRRSAEARLYLTSSNGERIVVRRVPLPDGLDELGRESIGQIVESSAVALASGAEIGMPREEAARVITAAPRSEVPSDQAESSGGAPAQRADKSASAPTRPWTAAPSTYRLGLAYGAEAFLPGPGIEHGPALGGAVIWGGSGTRVSLGLSAQYDVPVSASTNQVDLLLDGANFRVEGGPEFPLGAYTRIGVLGGAGVDLVRVQPQRTFEHTLAPGPADVFTNGAARAAIVLGLRLSPSVEVAAWAIADFSLAHTHFDILQGGTTSPTLTAWPVRPGLILAFYFAPEPTLAPSAR